MQPNLANRAVGKKNPHFLDKCIRRMMFRAYTTLVAQDCSGGVGVRNPGDIQIFPPERPFCRPQRVLGQVVLVVVGLPRRVVREVRPGAQREGTRRRVYMYNYYRLLVYTVSRPENVFVFFSSSGGWVKKQKNFNSPHFRILLRHVSI